MYFLRFTEYEYEVISMIHTAEEYPWDLLAEEYSECEVFMSDLCDQIILSVIMVERSTELTINVIA